MERLAVDRNDPGLLMLLTRKTRKELSYKALMVWTVWGGKSVEEGWNGAVWGCEGGCGMV